MGRTHENRSFGGIDSFGYGRRFPGACARLADLIDLFPSVIRSVRPYQLFCAVDGLPQNRTVNAAIPAHRGRGGTTILESFLLIAACKIVRAKRIFEFGTFLGSNTFNLALNLPDDGELFTLDLPHAGLVRDEIDRPLAEQHLTARLDFQGHPTERKVHRLCGDSRGFDFSPWHGSIDFVFIDGGHDAATVRSDTENAFALLNPAGPTCIAWHDYGHSDYPAVTAFLDEIAHPIVHVQDMGVSINLTDGLGTPHIGIM